MEINIFEIFASVAVLKSIKNDFSDRFIPKKHYVKIDSVKQPYKLTKVATSIKFDEMKNVGRNKISKNTFRFVIIFPFIVFENFIDLLSISEYYFSKLF